MGQLTNTCFLAHSSTVSPRQYDTQNTTQSNVIICSSCVIRFVIFLFSKQALFIPLQIIVVHPVNFIYEGVLLLYHTHIYHFFKKEMVPSKPSKVFFFLFRLKQFCRAKYKKKLESCQFLQVYEFFFWWDLTIQMLIRSHIY